MDKLRPEQRKLWRRTFLYRQEQGDDAELAATRADDAVAAWEARGAFEEDGARTAATPRPIDVGVDDLIRAGNPIVGVTVRIGPSGAFTFKGDLIDEMATGRRWYSVETRSLKDGDIIWCVGFDTTHEADCPKHDDMAMLRNARPGCSTTGLFNMKTPPPERVERT